MLVFDCEGGVVGGAKKKKNVQNVRADTGSREKCAGPDTERQNSQQRVN